MADVGELEEILQKTSIKVRQAVDTSISIKASGADANQQVAKMWETFLKEFIGYVKQKGRETGQNLFSGISFHKVMR